MVNNNVMLKRTTGGVRQINRRVKHDHKLESLERLVVVAMSLTLIAQLMVLTFESNHQWIIDTAGGVDVMNTHMMDTEIRSEPVKRQLRSMSPINKGSPSTDSKSGVDANEEHTQTKNGMTSIVRIDKDYPSADVIKSILSEQHQAVPYSNDNWLSNQERHSLNNRMHTLDDMAVVYEILYAFIAAFQREGIPIFLGFGSHIGARRHHGTLVMWRMNSVCSYPQRCAYHLLLGIIPFREKDIDLQVFSTDKNRVVSVIRSVLETKESWSSIVVELDEFGFGYRLNAESMEQHGLKYYIEFWLFGAVFDNRGHFHPNKVKCVGRKLQSSIYKGNTGCSRSYRYYAGASPPIFDHDDYFPPVYQVRMFNYPQYACIRFAVV